MGPSRDSLELPVKCKFCAERFSTLDELRFHAHSFHQTQFHKIGSWLDKLNPKIRSLESVAGEGLKGHYAGADFVPSEYSVLQPEEDELGVVGRLEELTGKGGESE